MIRQTGGTAVGETSTRSSCCCSASSSALEVGMTPSASPSAPMTRTSVARMALLMFTVGFAMTAPPELLEVLAFHCNEIDEIGRLHGIQVLAVAIARGHR